MGTVAFRGRLAAGLFPGVFTGSGGPLTTIADTSGPFSGFGNGFPALNDSGTVIFPAGLDAGGVGIFTGSGGPTTTIVTSDGPFLVFGAFPAINAGGQVAFLGLLDAGGSGIFTGPDPVNDRVIAIGDPLFGSTVTALEFYRGLNDAGQITFFAQLADGRQVIVRADPGASEAIPEPAACVLLGMGSLGALAFCRRQRRIQSA